MRAGTVDVANHGCLYVGLGAGWYEPEWLARMATTFQSCARSSRSHAHTFRGVFQ
jgi:hypothetical protein